jgi:hypothetical protein
MARYHSTNINHPDAMVLLWVNDNKLLVTDWESNQREYDLSEVVFEHELGDTQCFAYFSQNGSLWGENDKSSETFDIVIPNWTSDSQPLMMKAWIV